MKDEENWIFLKVFVKRDNINENFAWVDDNIYQYITKYPEHLRYYFIFHYNSVLSDSINNEEKGKLLWSKNLNGYRVSNDRHLVSFTKFRFFPIRFEYIRSFVNYLMSYTFGSPIIRMELYTYNMYDDIGARYMTLRIQNYVNTDILPTICEILTNTAKLRMQLSPNLSLASHKWLDILHLIGITISSDYDHLRIYYNSEKQRYENLSYWKEFYETINIFGDLPYYSKKQLGEEE